ncbi:hypothetical protein ACFV2Q_04395 [Streptomyces sp. NPDC059650]|uniref:hypothetical protein n=1 Tax=Streptomyces sp. NPDC059650 TaxID=3346896 RepID=UPI0036AC6F81
MSNTEGAAAFLAELSSPRPLEAAPVVGPRRGLAEGDRADAGSTPEPCGRLLGAPDTAGPTGAGWSWRPDPDRDTYLAEHLVDGRPLLPAAMMLALAAEAARQLSRGADVTGFRDLTVHEPLYTSPRGASVTCRITAECPGPNRVRVGLHSDLATQRGRILLRDRRHCRVDVVLGIRPLPPTPCRAPYASRREHRSSRGTLAPSSETRRRLRPSRRSDPAHRFDRAALPLPAAAEWGARHGRTGVQGGHRPVHRRPRHRARRRPPRRAAPALPHRGRPGSRRGAGWHGPTRRHRPQATS